MPTQPDDRRPSTTEWLGWHLIELALMTGGVALAVAVAPWLIVLTVLAGGAWVRAEVATRRTRAELTAGRQRPAVPAAHAEGGEDEMSHEEVAR